MPLVAPTTTPERLEAIGADARGFVYTVSLTGTTGERDELPPDLTATVERVRAASRDPGGGGVRHLDGRPGVGGGRAGRRRDRGQPVVRAAAEGGADGGGRSWSPSWTPALR